MSSLFGENYQAQHEDVVLPIRCAVPTYCARLVFLHKAVHVKGRSIESTSREFYYLAVRKLMRSLLNLESVQLSKRKYEQHASVYAELLVNGLTGDAFDAVAAIPTSDKTVQEPYLRAVEKRWPDVTNLNSFLSRSASSTDRVSCEERLNGTTFQPPTNLENKARILLIDDVLDSGVSAAAVIRAISRVGSDVTRQFTICCPLWITHQG